MAWGAGQPLVIEEVEVSPPQPQEIRIKVVATSLCGSDLAAWESQVISCALVLLLSSSVHQPKPKSKKGKSRVIVPVKLG